MSSISQPLLPWFAETAQRLPDCDQGADSCLEIKIHLYLMRRYRLFLCPVPVGKWYAPVQLLKQFRSLPPNNPM